MILFFSFVFLLNKYVTEPRDLEATISDINAGFKGVIVRKYSLRNTLPTCMTVQMENGKSIEICPDDELVTSSKIRDTIIKPKGENYVYIVNNEGKCVKYFYVRISNEDRKNKNFPQSWRNKWMDSSLWDEKK